MAKRIRKSDAAKERYWRGVVRGQGASDQSVRDYCRQAGVKESAFYWWRKKLARRSETRKAARQRTNTVLPRSSSVLGRKTAAQRPGGKGPAFLPVHVRADRTAAVSADHAVAVEIHLGDGRMVRVRPGVDRQTLVEVLAALEARPC